MSKAKVEEVKRVTGWGQIREQKRLGYSTLRWPDGTELEMPILAITYENMMEIDADIEAKMPPVPTIVVKVDGKPKTVENKDDEDYKRKVAEVQKERSLRIILKSLPEDVRPAGNEDEQMAALAKDLLAGHIVQLVRDIMTISNLNLDEAISEAKND